MDLGLKLRTDPIFIQRLIGLITQVV